MAAVAGCQRQPEESGPVASTPARPIRLMVIDDAPLAAAIRREWGVRGEGELIVDELSATDLIAAPHAPEADAVLYPPAMLGQLVQRNWLLPLDERLQQDPELAWRDIFNLVRLREVTWDRKTYGVPLGSPQLVLLYRGDVWEKHALTAPETWNDYQSALDVLREHHPVGDAAQPRVTVEPLAAGWGSQMLLARAAAYSLYRGTLATWFELETMRPQLQTPPLVRAMKELVAAAEGTESLEADPYGALVAFCRGEALSAVTWPTAAIELPEDAPELPPNAVRVAELPGSEEAYLPDRDAWEKRHKEDDGWRVSLLGVAGRQASVLRRSSQPTSAGNVLVWLAGKTFSDQVAPASRVTTMFRQQHAQFPRRWVPELFSDEATLEYTDTLLQATSRRGSVHSIRIPGREKYLEALDAAVSSAVSGQQSVEAALEQAAAQWEAITDEFGRDQQRAAYRQSLNL